MTALFEYMTALLEYFDLLLSNIGQVKFSHDPLTNRYSLGPCFFAKKMTKSCLGGFKENFQGINR